MDLSENQNTVLFVDDEVKILHTIKRSLITAEFRVLTASSIEEAFEILENESIAILVSDMKMPGKGGYEFLKRVMNEYPQVYRVILSGYIEKDVVLKALMEGVAFTYFSKPWKADEIENKISHILSLKEKLYNEKLLKIINSIDKLPVVSKLYRKIVAAVTKGSSYRKIAALINENPAFTAKLLHVANSAFYSGEKISSVENAIGRIGLNVVSNIILSLSAVSSMNWSKKDQGIIEEIFTHSARVNKLTEKIYLIKERKKLPIEYSSLGIMHDIGKLIILQYFPERYTKIMKAIEHDSSIDFYDAEILLGFKDYTHCEIGASFLDMWNLPQVSVETALFHHQKEQQSDFKEIILAVYYANIIEKYFSRAESLKDFKTEYFNDQEISELEKEIMKIT